MKHLSENRLNSSEAPHSFTARNFAGISKLRAVDIKFPLFPSEKGGTSPFLRGEKSDFFLHT